MNRATGTKPSTLLLAVIVSALLFSAVQAVLAQRTFPPREPITIPRPPVLQPRISDVLPKDPDGWPYLTLGGSTTVIGQYFSPVASENLVVLSSPGATAPPADTPARLAELTATSATAGRIDARIPNVMATGFPRGNALLWVQTRGMWSNPVQVFVELPTAPQPIISEIEPQVPGLPTTIRGTNFNPSARVWFWLTDTTNRSLDVIEFGSSSLRVIIPLHIDPGNYRVTVSVDRSPMSQPFIAQVSKPVMLNLYSPYPGSFSPYSNLNPRFGGQLVDKEFFPYVANIDPSPPNSPHLGPPFVTQNLTRDSGVCDFLIWLSGNPHGPEKGHVNYGVATYEGPIWWYSHDTDDDDYNFKLLPPEGAGTTLTDHRAIKLEFDSDETVDDMDRGWWNTFHEAVNFDAALEVVGEHRDVAGALVRQKHAIATGLFGLDCAHECGSELHPVYSLAVNIDNRQHNDKWAIFARNWGDEGFCGDQDHLAYFPENAYTLRVPWRAGATSAHVTSIDFYRTPNATGSVAYNVVPGEGVFLRINFADPVEHPLLWGEVNIDWQGTLAVPVQAAIPAPTKGDLSAEELLRQRIKSRGMEIDQLIRRQANERLSVARRARTRSGTTVSVVAGPNERLGINRVAPPIVTRTVPYEMKREKDLIRTEILVRNGIFAEQSLQRLREKYGR